MILSLALAALVQAGPESVVRDFYQAWAGGDVARAAAMWKEDARAEFRNAHGRSNVRCRTIAVARVALAGQTDDAARVEVDALETTWTAGRRPRSTAHHAVISLGRDGGGRWRIADWRRRELELADRWIAAAGPAARDALLHASPELWTPALAEALSVRAVAFMNGDQYADVPEILEAAQRIANETGDEVARSAVLGARSVYHRRAASDEPASLRLAEEAVAAAERSDDSDTLARAWLRLSRTDGPRSAAAARHVLDMVDETEDIGLAALAAARMVHIHNAGFDYSAALRYGLLALRHAETRGGKAHIVNAAMAVSSTYMGQGGYELAIPHLERALTLAREERGAGTVAALLSGLAKCHLHLGNVDRFFDYSKEALAAPVMDRCLSEPDVLLMRVRENVRRGDLESAERDVQQVLGRKDCDDAQPYVALAWLRLAQNRIDEALLAADRARCMTENPDFAGFSGLVIARGLRAKGRLQEARDALEAVLDHTESLRESVASPHLRHELLRDRSDAYRELVDLLAEMNEPKETFVAAERLKARVLRELRRQRAARIDELMNPAERQRAGELEERIGTLNRLVRLRGAETGDELARARVELQDFEARVLATYDLRKRAAEKTDLTLRVAPPPGVDVVEYVVGESRTIALVITRGAGGEAVVTQTIIPVSERDLHKRVDACLFHISQRSGVYAREAKAMYELLLAPLQPQLKGNTLCIIPDEGLWRLPFHALQTPDGKHLLESREIVYAPSYALLQESPPGRASRSKPTVLALGNPRLDAATASAARAWHRDARLGDLPEAEEEVRALSRLYGSRARVYVGSAASEELLKRESGRSHILHFATHGLLDSKAPLFSALVLAASGSDDGLLEAREIAELPLDADLAILSACDTARGEFAAGEGILGLSWALMATGCPRTIGTQWRVDSAAATRLMIAFHRRLSRRSSLGRVAADLRRAQLELLRSESHAHPYYWAGFVLIGRDW